MGPDEKMAQLEAEVRRLKVSNDRLRLLAEAYERLFEFRNQMGGMFS